MRRLRHGAAELVLHPLKEGSGPTLLCLHELESDARQWQGVADAWPGTAVALDFAGHGQSSWLAGGGYMPELFAADADVALAILAVDGPVWLVGAGIGAYVALLVAGARPDDVAVAGLLPGRGFEGGGAAPADTPQEDDSGAQLHELADRAIDTSLATDPLVGMSRTDFRPPDYAGFFAATARALLLGEDGTDRPPWWHAVREGERSSTGPADPVEMVVALADRI